MVTEFVTSDETSGWAEADEPVIRGQFTQMLLPEEGFTPRAP
jgi:hypothetical protein